MGGIRLRERGGRAWICVLRAILLIGAVAMPATAQATALAHGAAMGMAAAPRVALAPARLAYTRSLVAEATPPSADLSVQSVTARNADAVVGAATQQGFDAVVANAGPDSAQDVTFTIPLPAHTTYAGDTIGGVLCQGLDRGATSGQLTCTAASLGPGQTVSASLLFTVNADAPTGALSSTVSATDDTPDPDQSNNTMTGAVQALNDNSLSADLSVDRVTPISQTAVAGDGTRQGFDVMVSNAGPDTATNITFTIPLPAHTTYDGGGWTQGMHGGCSGLDYGVRSGAQGLTETCTLDSLAAHSSADVAVMFYIDQDAPAGTISETVAITSGGVDPNPGNNSLTGTMQVLPHPVNPDGPSADLVVDSVSPSSGAVAGDGSLQGFNVVIRNAGPDVAQNVTFTVPLPAHTSLVNLSETGVWCTGLATGAESGVETCTASSLAVGQVLYASLGFVIDYDAPGGAISSTVAVTSATRDPNTGNNTLTGVMPFSQAAIDPSHPLADLRIESVTPDNPVVMAGDGAIHSFTIALRNAGPSPAQNVLLRVPVPPYVQYAGVQDGGMSCLPPPPGVTPPPDMECTLRSLAPSQSPTYVTIDFLVDWWARGSTVDIVSVSSDTPDPNPNNNGGMGTTAIVAPPPPTMGPAATPVITPTGTAVSTASPSATAAQPTKTATTRPPAATATTVPATATMIATAIPSATDTPAPPATNTAAPPVNTTKVDSPPAPPQPPTAVKTVVVAAAPTAATATRTPTRSPVGDRVVDRPTPASPREPNVPNVAVPTPRPTVDVRITLPLSAGGGGGDSGAAGSSSASGPHGAAPTLADDKPIQVALPADPANAGKVDTVTLVIYGTRAVTQTVTLYSRIGTTHATFAPGAFAAMDAGAPSAGAGAPRRAPCAKGSVGCRPFRVMRRVQQTVTLYQAKVAVRADHAGRLHVAMPLHVAVKGAARVTLALTVQTPSGASTVRRAVVIASRASSRKQASRPAHKPARRR